METVYFSLVTLVPAATLSRFFGESIRAKYEFKFYKFKSLLDGIFMGSPVALNNLIHQTFPVDSIHPLRVKFFHQIQKLMLQLLEVTSHR